MNAIKKGIEKQTGLIIDMHAVFSSPETSAYKRYLRRRVCDYEERWHSATGRRAWHIVGATGKGSARHLRGHTAAHVPYVHG